MIPLRSPFDGAELALPRPHGRARSHPRRCSREGPAAEGAPIAGSILVVGG
jgi:hypothetical protein